VKLTDRGAIDIDDHMRTNVEGIYAIGDVTASCSSPTSPRRRPSSPPRPSARRRP
jgi:hypothetical protein